MIRGILVSGGSRQAARIRVALIGALFAVAAAALLLLSPMSKAAIYWSNAGSGAGTTIGTSTNDGTDVDQSFITTRVYPRGVAADATHIYWSAGYEGTASIGRVPIDGNEPDPDFVEPDQCDEPLDLRSPQGIAVDETHIYWVDTTSVLIGRARLDGSSVECDWFAQPNPLKSVERDVAVDDRYLYWTQTQEPEAGLPGRIGRVEKASPGTFDFDFITDAGSVGSVAVNETHIFWAQQFLPGEFLPGEIRRLPIDGSGTPQIVLEGGSAIAGVGLSRDFVYYVTNATSGAIGRVGIDAVSGSGEQVVTGVDNGFLLAVTTPAGTISPSTHDFGEVQIGQTASQAVTLTSTGDAPLTIPADGISVTDGAAGFGVTGGTCQAGTTSLANGESCTVVASFEPTTAGSKSADLEVTTNAGTFSSALSGIGAEAPIPAPFFRRVEFIPSSKRVRGPRKGKKKITLRVQVFNFGDAAGTATVGLRSSSRKVRVPGRVRMQVPAGSSKARSFRVTVLPRAPRRVTLTAKLPNKRSDKLVLRVKR